MPFTLASFARSLKTCQNIYVYRVGTDSAVERATHRHNVLELEKSSPPTKKTDAPKLLWDGETEVLLNE